MKPRSRDAHFHFRDLVIRHERTLHATEQAKENVIGPVVEVPSKTRTRYGEIRLDSHSQLIKPQRTDAQAQSTEDTIVVDANSEVTSPRIEIDASVHRGATLTGFNERTEMELEVEDHIQDLDKAQRSLDAAHMPSAPSEFEALLSTNSAGLDVDFEINNQSSQYDFGTASNRDFISTNNFDELDFFGLFPGLPPDQTPFLSFNRNDDRPDHFSPLEQASASSHSPRRADSDPVFRAGESRQPDIPPSIPEHTDAVKQHLPRIIKYVAGKPPNLVLDDMKWRSLKTDLKSRLSEEQMISFVLPTSTSLQKCLRTYFDSVHVHLPLFHLHTLDLVGTPSPLILAMCAVGALFRLERKVAASLYAKADEALQHSQWNVHGDVMSPNSMEDWIRPRRGSSILTSRPIWMTQCKLLLTFFAGFSGSPVFIRTAIEGMGILANVSRLS